MHRIYYHLYMGPSWRQVWSIHWPLLCSFAQSGLLERLVVCCYGEPDHVLMSTAPEWAEFRHCGSRLDGINEFDTLACAQLEARSSSATFSSCVYMHSKSSSSVSLSETGAAWTRVLAESLLGTARRFPNIEAAGFNCAGSNLAWGLFEHFSPPRLHYSGNFWCATRQLVARTQTIDLRNPRSSIRHDAEWWLSTAPEMLPFNLFCTGIDHYRDPPELIDWPRLAERLERLHVTGNAVHRAQAQVAFVRTQACAIAGLQPFRHALSTLLLKVLLHRRWPRLLNVHDRLMRLAGSRKSCYFYCPES